MLRGMPSSSPEQTSRHTLRSRFVALRLLPARHCPGGSLPGTVVKLTLCGPAEIEFHGSSIPSLHASTGSYPTMTMSCCQVPVASASAARAWGSAAGLRRCVHQSSCVTSDSRAPVAHPAHPVLLQSPRLVHKGASVSTTWWLLSGRASVPHAPAICNTTFRHKSWLRIRHARASAPDRVQFPGSDSIQDPAE
jgi:hypothetical protein